MCVYDEKDAIHFTVWLNPGMLTRHSSYDDDDNNNSSDDSSDEAMEDYAW